MVSSIGSGSSQNAVAQVLRQQSERVDEQKAQQAAEQRRQVQIELEKEINAQRKQVNTDEKLGRTVDLRV